MNFFIISLGLFAVKCGNHYWASQLPAEIVRRRNGVLTTKLFSRNCWAESEVVCVLDVLVRALLERDVYICGLSQSSNLCIFCLFWDSLCAMHSLPLYQEANHLPYQLVVKSGKAICGHPLNKKTMLGIGETMKLVRLRQQMLFQLVGSSCVLWRVVHEPPFKDVAGTCGEWMDSHYPEISYNVNMQNYIPLNRKTRLENHSEVIVVCPWTSERGREKYNVLSKTALPFISHLLSLVILPCLFSM